MRQFAHPDLHPGIFHGAKVLKFQAARSPGKYAGTKIEKYAGRPFDMWALKRVMPDRWSEFVRTFFADHTHVAYVFSVDDKTARAWWEGSNSPRSEAMLAAVKNIPGALDFLLVAA